jgi:hypothetical protein
VRSARRARRGEDGAWRERVVRVSFGWLERVVRVSCGACH